ncbi:MAG: hypothetical protein K2M43_01800, partial [Mycoplasmoidaceae bacterium]|nr:hypothetical protein [Mycoplasmoidaceae bacterium]
SKDTNTKNKNSIKTQPVSTKRKLSLISAILIVIGSSIGAGIFLKNDDVLKNTQGNIYLALVA